MRGDCIACDALFQSISGRLPKRGRKRREKIEKSKNVQTAPPAPIASATGPCPPTIIQIVGRPCTGSLPRTITPPDHPITSLIKHGKDIETFIYLTRIDDWSYLPTKEKVTACNFIFRSVDYGYVETTKGSCERILTVHAKLSGY